MLNVTLSAGFRQRRAIGVPGFLFLPVRGRVPLASLLSR